MKKASSAFCFAAFLLSALPASAIDSSLVNETRWSVAQFESGKPSNYHSVPWVFHPARQVNAGSLWSGAWRDAWADKIAVQITFATGGTDMFEVVFLSPRWFVAMKNGELYRLGKREQ